MSDKYRKPSDELSALFTDVLSKTSIPQWVEFEILCNDKLNEVYKISKLNDAIEAITKLNFLVIINEEIFERLTREQQIIVIDECLTGVSISESDNISLKKPNITTFDGILSKYGDSEVIVLKETLTSLFGEKRQSEEKMKQAKKESRD
jgi:hypothetical protein